MALGRKGEETVMGSGGARFGTRGLSGGRLLVGTTGFGRVWNHQGKGEAATSPTARAARNATMSRRFMLGGVVSNSSACVTGGTVTGEEVCWNQRGRDGNGFARLAPMQIFGITKAGFTAITVAVFALWSCIAMEAIALGRGRADARAVEQMRRRPASTPRAPFASPAVKSS